jgi:proteasome accessory factor C
MSRTAERLNRILAMLPWVIANPGVTVDEVCERFGYTRQQLLSDLDLVFVCGLPGYGPGDLMVAYVEDDEVYVDMADYFSSSLRLSPREALALLAAGMALTSTGHAPPGLERAVDKLARVVVPEAGEVVSVDLAGEPELVDVLRGAARDHRVVALTYTSLSKGETRERLVEPWSVFTALGNWYLSGFCRAADGERVFRVDRIRTARPTDEGFEPPTDVPSPEVRYTPSEDDVRAKIRLKPTAGWVAEYYPVEVLKQDAGGLIVNFSAGDPHVAALLLLRLGSAAELLEGDEVGAELGRLRTRILARYGVP